MTDLELEVATISHRTQKKEASETPFLLQQLEAEEELIRARKANQDLLELHESTLQSKKYLVV